MPRLAIVIPAVGPIDVLESSLVSVLEHRPDDCEVIVVFNQPYEDPYGLDGEVRFVQAPVKSGIVDCVNRGIAHSHADLVHVLLAGCEVTEGWTDRALAHFDDPRVGAVAPCVQWKHADQQTVCRGIELCPGGVRRFYEGLRPTTAGESVCAVWGPPIFAAFYRVSALARWALSAAPWEMNSPTRIWRARCAARSGKLLGNRRLW